ncbi:MAG: hypothetical protein E7259_01055 [Lachnospiraceae bacterium]|nr:hypothetical protein [Lachnospiraceae bacterium]
MTKSELQKILDKGAIPFKKFNRAKNANKVFSADEEQTLYDIIDDCETSESFDYDKALDKIVGIINNHPEVRDFDLGYHGDVPLVATEMPFLIKQVLFYLCYKIKKSNITTKKFMEELNNRGLAKTKKFLNMGGMTPDGYYTMSKYKQPVNPCPYKGQKKDELAYAIKNLAYQAGAYSYFVDIFGGSGSASTALYPQDKVKQVYNEKNKAVYNLFEVISSERYVELQEGIKRLQEDLAKPDYTIDPYYGFDIEEVLSKYRNDKLNSVRKKKDTIEEECEIFGNYDCDFKFYDSEKEDFMGVFQDQIDMKYPRNKEFDGYTYDEIKKWTTKEDFDKYFDVINSIQEQFFGIMYHNKMLIRLSGDIVKDGQVVRKDIYYRDYKANIVQLKALAYFAYFINLRKTNIKENSKEIQCAVGEIYLHKLATQGDIISSSILGFNRSELENKRNELKNFINNKKLNIEITNYHNRVSRCYNQALLRNTDFRTVIKEFAEKNKNVLFYSDSPYIATSDYDDEDIDVNEFTKNDIRELIDLLTKSKKKFIFSMRAVKSGGNKQKKVDIGKGNKDIYDSVYNTFKKSKRLYVLVILNQNISLDEAIRKNKVIEIMVTNFPIMSFDNYKKSSKTFFKFEVYKFKDFMKIIDENMLLPN